MIKKDIKRRRTMNYFIDAADEIIKKEGIDKVTIRKVADIAGYNSATLYNYFENLDHLIFFAAMRYIKDYAHALPKYLKGIENPIERFIRIWECFCYFSYKNPEIYYAIFFANLYHDLEEYVVDYYKLYPEELGKQNEGISTMLLKHNIYERGMDTLTDCVHEGFIHKDDAKDLNDICTLLHEGILLKVMKEKIGHDEALNKTMKYIIHITNSFLLKEYKDK